jgi:checkpoint serine/threonine-protein kinase
VVFGRLSHVYNSPQSLRQADELYRHGIYRKARPVDRLKIKYEQFQQRNPSKSVSNLGHNRYAPMLARPDPGKRPERLRLDFGLLFKDGVEYSIQEARARSMGLLGKKWPPPAPTDLDLKRSGQSRVKFNDDGTGGAHSRRGLMPPPEPTVTLATKEALADVFGMYNSPDKTSKFGIPGSKHAPVHTVKIVPRTVSQTHIRDLGEVALKQPGM